MPNIQQFLQEIGHMEPKREGSQWRIPCPECKDPDHLYVADDTGLAYCHKCAFKSNPFTLAQNATGLATEGVMALLDRFGLSNGETGTQRSTEPQKPILTGETVRQATDEEMQQLAESKNVNIDALRKLAPLMYRDKPIMLLPCYRTSNTVTPCGALRVRLDGQPIMVNNKPQKYPMISGGKHGLLGVKWLNEENPETILFCEAWRDMLAAIEAGYAATASTGGASTWRDDWLDIFTDKTVYIIMDCDTAGQRAAPRAAERIYTVAKKVLIVPPWVEVAEKHGSDLFDYLEAAG